MSETTAAIELEGVVKQFGSEQVLKGVDLAVPRGKITVLLGPSGAGKTVTINHIVGLLEPTEGVVKVEGKVLGMLSDEELNEVRRGMSIAMQGNQPFTCGLFFSIDVFENVAFPLRERTGLSPEEIEQTAMAHLSMVGLHDHARQMPDQLSSGERKRTALARALALDARIVIIDDFDSGIDGVRLGLLTELIDDVHKATGATFLITTHDMNAARQLADYVAVIHEGRIVERGTPEMVFDTSEPAAKQLITGSVTGPVQLGDV